MWHSTSPQGHRLQAGRPARVMPAWCVQPLLHVMNALELLGLGLHTRHDPMIHTPEVASAYKSECACMALLHRFG